MFDGGGVILMGKGVINGSCQSDDFAPDIAIIKDKSVELVVRGLCHKGSLNIRLLVVVAIMMLIYKILYVAAIIYDEFT